MGQVGIPKTWTVTRLAELGEWGSGGTPSRTNPSYYGGDIPWLKIGDLNDGEVWGAEESISKLGLENSSAKLLEPGVILVAMYGSIGKIGLTRIPCATNQAIAFCRPDERLIDRRYLFWGLRHLRQKLLALGQGGTQLNISQTLLKNVELPLAPLNEQRRIVEKIEALFAELDKGEESLRQVQTLLARYRQSVLKAAVNIESRVWQQICLADLLVDIRYGTAKKCRPDGKGVAVLRIPNVVSGGIDLRDLKYAELSDKELAKLSLRNGDLLLIRSNGSASLVGQSAVVTNEAEGMAFAGYLIRLRVDQNRLLPAYLKLVLDAPQTRSRIERQARSTSGVHNINSDEVKAISFALPPVSEQREIVEKTSTHLNQVRLLEEACQLEFSRSAALRQSILNAAFSGKLVPQNRNDEPASELLACIRSQRAAQPPKASRGTATA